jgi:DNA-binding beta-propeller fold protein YncE
MQKIGFFMLVISTFGISLLMFTVVISSVAASPIQKTLGDEMEQTYTFIKKWGGEGTGDGEFLRPHDLDFSPDEKILYAVDRDGNRIQAFDKNGTFLFAWGKLGKGDGQFHVPYGIDVDVKGNVWVVDRANDRVQKFDSNGNFILKFGNTDAEPSDELGKFDNPRHVAVDKDLRYVYVADSKNNRIQKFNINGSFIETIGKLGNKRGEFNLLLRSK